jgi:hypothetical protein
MSARRNLAILLLAGCFIRLCRTAARGDLEPLDLQTAKMVERWRGPANELMLLFSEIGMRLERPLFSARSSSCCMR